MAKEYKLDIYKDAANNSLAVGNGNPNQAPSNTDQYTALETTSYKDMLSSKIQAANAREQALKYASTSLGASGYGSQGMAESTRTGVYGTYQNAIQNADATHQANLLDIQAQRESDLEANQNEKWQSAMTMMQQATSQSDLDYLRNNYYDSMTDEQKKMFDYYYASYSSNFDDNTANTNTLYSYNDNKAYAYDANGGSVSTTNKFNYENDTLNSAIATGKIATGTYIQLHNVGNESVYLYYGKDGRLYYVNENTFKNAKNKVNIHGTETAIREGEYTKQ